jgi:hypothetical protein
MEESNQMKAMTDEEIVAKHDLSIQDRARKELLIVNQLIIDAERFNYTLKVKKFEPEKYDFKTAVFDLDDVNIQVVDANKKEVGWIYLVFGNDGWNLISDYSLSVGALLMGCREVANKIKKGQYKITLI